MIYLLFLLQIMGYKYWDIRESQIQHKLISKIFPKYVCTTYHQKLDFTLTSLILITFVNTYKADCRQQLFRQLPLLNKFCYNYLI